MENLKNLKGAKILNKNDQKSIFGGKVAPPMPELCECYIIIYHPDHPEVAIGWMPNDPAKLSAHCRDLCGF